MREERFVTSETPEVIVENCSGNLTVKSWRETAVSVQSPSFTAEQTAAHSLRITAVDDLYLAVPKQTRLTLGTIGGSLTIKHVSGSVIVDDVAGSVTLGNVDAVTITRAAQGVQGDNVNSLLVVTEAGGAVDVRSASAVQIERALAGVTLQFVNGDVSLGQVGGPLDVRTVNGDLTVAEAQGNVILANLGRAVRVSRAESIWLVGGLASGAHHLEALGSVYVYWPPDAPLNLTARGALVEHRLPLEKVEVALENEQTVLTGRIEDGKVDLFVQAGQRVALKALAETAPQFAETDFQFIAPKSAEIGDLATAVHAVFAEIAAELPATTLAQLAAVRLEERLVTAVTAIPTPPPPEAPTPPSAPADEQRHILQLLKDDQLSVAQAQLLLAALKD